MRHLRVLLVALALAACAPIDAHPARALPRLKADGRSLVADGKPFAWRFVTAFRLVDYVADRQEDKAVTFLDWAAKSGFNGVRVLTTLCCWFDLSPDAGRAALPRLLDLAAERGLYVEVVAVAGAKEQSLTDDAIRAHVAGIGRIVARHTNAVVELANENAHATQVPSLTNVPFLIALRALVPRDVPVSLGSNCCGAAESSSRYPAAAGGDYLTIHTERNDDPAKRLAELAALRQLSIASDRYVVADEPIGAAERPEPGRRVSNPSDFFNEAAEARTLGIGMTFHCEDCLQAVVPGPVQRQCAEAFIRGWHIQ